MKDSEFSLSLLCTRPGGLPWSTAVRAGSEWEARESLFQLLLQDNLFDYRSPVGLTKMKDNNACNTSHFFILTTQLVVSRQQHRQRKRMEMKIQVLVNQHHDAVMDRHIYK